MGEPVRERIRAVGKKYGYTMSVYRTKSLFHGVPQIRERSFYFFWKGDKAPILNYFRRDHQRIEDLILGVKSNFQTETPTKKKPSEDALYRFVLEEVAGGVTHREFSKGIMKSTQVLEIIEDNGVSYEQLGEWLTKKGYEREAAWTGRVTEKLAKGGGIMHRSIIIPKDYIGAFVGHLQINIAHPTKDRFLNYRECMTIMGLPQDFELLDPKRQLNHVCQNVPVDTAADMASEVVAALEDERPWVKTDYLFQSNHQQKHETRDDSPTSMVSVEAAFA